MFVPPILFQFPEASRRSRSPSLRWMTWSFWSGRSLWSPTVLLPSMRWDIALPCNFVGRFSVNRWNVYSNISFPLLLLLFSFLSIKASLQKHWCRIHFPFTFTITVILFGVLNLFLSIIEITEGQCFYYKWWIKVPHNFKLNQNVFNCH